MGSTAYLRRMQPGGRVMLHPLYYTLPIPGNQASQICHPVRTGIFSYPTPSCAFVTPRVDADFSTLLSTGLFIFAAGGRAGVLRMLSAPWVAQRP